MPVEFGFETCAEKEVLLPFFTGYVTRGVLLHLLQNMDPSASETLHEANVRKAYAVTPLYFRSKAKTDRGYLLDPAYPCRFKVRFLTDTYAKLLLKCFEAQSNILIYDTAFQVNSIAVKSKSYSELWSESKPVESFRLVFQTPTCFAALGQRYYCLFPEPKRVFGGLLSLWNLCSDQDKVEDSEKEDYLSWLGRAGGISGFSLRTQKVSTGKGVAIGFTGWVTYRTQTHERWQKLTTCLARMAEYSNVGKGRTAGFGAVEFLGRE